MPRGEQLGRERVAADEQAAQVGHDRGALRQCLLEHLADRGPLGGLHVLGEVGVGRQVEELVHPGAHMLDDRLAQAGLRPEVVDHERGRHLGPLGDLSHRHGVLAALGEELERGIAHPRPPGPIVD